MRKEQSSITRLITAFERISSSEHAVFQSSDLSADISRHSTDSYLVMGTETGSIHFRNSQYVEDNVELVLLLCHSKKLFWFRTCYNEVNLFELVVEMRS